MSENEDSLPRLLGGRYRLEAKLGSGGMGVVYRASDLTMHRSVAVKLIRGVDGVALDEEVAGRFLREAKNTARIQHENIIEVYDLGRSDQGDMFFVMELLEGESLSAKIRRDGKLPVTQSVRIAKQMCAALHVTHAAGIIHRDLKPANVMLIHRAGQGDYVKVLDFGVAKSYTPDQQTQLTHTGMLVGTVEYMAPEQIMGRKVDGRTDIYALGVVLYRMLTGKAPFRDGGVPALIHAHLNVPPKSMTELAPELPGALDRVVLRCLAKQPEQRFESMEEVSRALSGALEPADLGLVSLEYQNDDDPYEIGVQTEVARPPLEAEEPPKTRQPGKARPPQAPREALPDPTRMVIDESYDDATIRLDRPEIASGPARPPVAAPPAAGVPSFAGLGGDEGFDRTAVMPPREEATAKRSVPEEVARFERAGPRECAMCRTMNPPHARACNACGVSLARDDQEAVRARVTAPRTARLSAPQVPPPFGGHPPARGVPGVEQGGGHHGPPGHGMHGGMHQGQPHPLPMQRNSLQGVAWGSRPSTHAPPEPPTVWQRFLSWTGLRGR